MVALIKKKKRQAMVCGLCHKGIKEKDNFVILDDYKKGSFFMRGYYHTNCYNNQIRGHLKLMDNLNNFISDSRRMITGKEEEKIIEV